MNRKLLAAIDGALPCQSLRPFPAPLEEHYRQRSRPVREDNLARILLATGVCDAICFGFDALTGVDPLAAAAGFRLAFAILLLLGRSALTWTRSDRMETAMVILLTVGVTVLTAILGKLAPVSEADRYMDAAYFSMFAVLATCPGRPRDCLLAGVAAVVLFTAVLGLVPGPVHLHGNWNFPLFSACALAASVAIVRRTEIARRNEFLHALRHELEATELNLLNAELLRLSSTDELTGLPNRRQIENDIRRFWAERPYPGLGMALIDVDFFKPFNDTAGHEAGDSCLCVVANALRGALEDPEAIVGRFGGEEFLVLAPGIDRATLTQLGERLRRAVEQENLPHPAFPGHSVTVSIGLSWRDASALSGRVEDLIREADQALYAAKGAGRNRLAPAAPAPIAAPRLVSALWR